ncbi:MAG: PqqD family protein [Deltaproteobacteria bacterium]|nr:PqqD family protein [Deltaproteobacteria bacterium]
MKKQLMDIAVSETGFVFDPSTGHTYRLNKTGMVIVKMLQGGDDINMIAERLAEGFDTNKDRAVEDIIEFLSLLKTMGFRIDVPKV